VSDFERFYPEEFATDVEAVLRLPHGQRRLQKEELRSKVAAWVVEDDDRAKKAFESSADEVIRFLVSIERTVCGP
jgi:hypothetical protein